MKNIIKRLAGIFRPDCRKKVLKMLSKGSVGAEIGSWKGDFSQMIIDIAKPKELHLIDPWKFQTEFGQRWYGGSIAQDQSDMDQIFEDVKNRFEKYNNIKIHRDFSEFVADKFADSYLDFVYIDGNHYYEFVKKDLELYFPKIKSGGFLLGDDYSWTSPELKQKRPVKQAVDEFVEKYRDKVEELVLVDNQFVIKKK